MADGLPSYALMDTVVHELAHHANPEEHPEKLYREFVNVTETAARLAYSNTPVSAEMRGRLAAEMAAHIREQFGITPEKMGTISLEAVDLPLRLDLYLKGDSVESRQRYIETYGSGFAFTETAADFQKQAMERHRLSPEEVAIDTFRAMGATSERYSALFINEPSSAMKSSEKRVTHQEAEPHSEAQCHCSQSRRQSAPVPEEPSQSQTGSPPKQESGNSSGTSHESAGGRDATIIIPEHLRDKTPAGSTGRLVPRSEAKVVELTNRVMRENFCDPIARDGYSDNAHRANPLRLDPIDPSCRRPAGVSYSPDPDKEGEIGQLPPPPRPLARTAPQPESPAK